MHTKLVHKKPPPKPTVLPRKIITWVWSKWLKTVCHRVADHWLSLQLHLGPVCVCGKIYLPESQFKFTSKWRSLVCEVHPKTLNETDWKILKRTLTRKQDFCEGVFKPDCMNDTKTAWCKAKRASFVPAIHCHLFGLHKQPIWWCTYPQDNEGK